MSGFDEDPLGSLPARAAEAEAALLALQAPAEKAAGAIDAAFARAGAGLARSLARAAADGEISLAELARAVMEVVAQTLGRGDVDDLGLVAHRQAGDMPEPVEIIGPVGAGDLHQRVPGRRTVAGFVPGLVGEARHVEVGPGEVLGAAQGRHARVAAPRALGTRRGAIDHQDVGHLRAQQSEGGRQAGLAGADDQHVQRR